MILVVKIGDYHVATSCDYWETQGGLLVARLGGEKGKAVASAPVAGDWAIVTEEAYAAVRNAAKGDHR